jgi:ATP synthase protein I
MQAAHAEMRGVMGDSGPPNSWRLAGAGMEFAGAILLMAGLGYLVDRWANTDPWALLVGVVVGFAGGLYNLVKLAKTGER